VGHDVPVLGTAESGGLDGGRQPCLRVHDDTGLLVPADRSIDEPGGYEPGCSAAPPGRTDSEKMVSDFLG